MEQNTLPSPITKRKRTRGDRKDGFLIKELDPLHFLMPYMFPNRCDNEAFFLDSIDLTAADKYIKAKNNEDPEFKYKLFQIIIAAIVKTLVLRPEMNRFIQGYKMYHRNELSVSFVIKKVFNDTGAEALAYIRFDENDTLETIRDKISNEINSGRSEELDGATASLSMISKIPNFIIRWAVKVLHFLDFRGRFPQSMAATDPNYATVFLTNLGSIGLKAGYHHLANRGTNSIFIVVGKAHKAPDFHDDGTFEMKKTIDIGITLDERIADGFYFSQTIKLLKYLVAHPEQLEKPAKEPVPLHIR